MAKRLVVLASLPWIACSGALTPGGNGGEIGGNDPGGAVGGTDTDDSGGQDGSAAKSEATLAGDVPGDAWAPEPGELGHPCDKANDCFSDYCVEASAGMVCSESCSGEHPCPAGWGCKQIAEGEAAFFCIPSFVNLCRPCNGNADCNPDGIGHLCLGTAATGSFCGGDCSTTSCPSGYTCTIVPNGLGGDAQQCLPDSGECACSEKSVALGASTGCSIQNDFGTCMGKRMCKEEGLGACDALIPAAEVCDAIDNDCNTQTDEGLSGNTCDHENEFGTCTGAETCALGEWVCGAPAAEPETCNGKDDDCDEEIDEIFSDIDGDGTADCLDDDDDGDGVSDGEDNCPKLANPDQADHDLDGMGYPCDPDDDNDQVADELDCAPFDKSAYSAANEVCDGVDNNCDGDIDEGFPDTDQDGDKNCVDADDDDDDVPDDGDNCAVDANPDQLDTDSDDKGDACDLDDDGDTVPDEDDNCPLAYNQDQADPDGDELGNACDPDDDGDNAPDELDNCPLTPNPDQLDSDQDGLGDQCDADKDQDGRQDELDNCPLVFNPDQSDADQDLVGDVCDPDDDNDDAPDLTDNCPLSYNPNQLDTDLDGFGNVCDPDDDDDGVVDFSDCEPLNKDVFPGNVEVCNGVDDNCVLLADEVGAEGCTDLYYDYDNDGFGKDDHLCLCGPLGFYRAPVAGDCADENFDAKPLTQERCDTLFDDDCSESTNDEGAIGCEDFFFDGDSDGYGVDPDTDPSKAPRCLCVQEGKYNSQQVKFDCKDGVFEINPGVQEKCNDGIDNNCDDSQNDLDAKGCMPMYLDHDDDGYGIGSAQCFCEPAGEIRAFKAGDCDDNNNLANKSQLEKCSTPFDDDCDADEAINEEGAEGCKVYWYDADGDNYGLTWNSKCLCLENQIPNYRGDQGGDCNDDPAIGGSGVFPQNAEICDGKDQDCTLTADDAPIASMCGTPDHGSAVCAGLNGCQISGCSQDWHNLNGNYGDGCECPEDANDLGLTGNNSCPDATDLGTLTDASQNLTTASGGLVPAGDQDFFKFTAADDADSSGDEFHVDIRFTSNPNGNYRFDVWRGTCGGADGCTGLDQYEWYTDFGGNAPPALGEGTCSNATNPGTGGVATAGQNFCTDNTNTFWVRVYRAAGSTVCESYALQISNGIY